MWVGLGMRESFAQWKAWGKKRVKQRRKDARKVGRHARALSLGRYPTRGGQAEPTNGRERFGPSLCACAVDAAVAGRWVADPGRPFERRGMSTRDRRSSASWRSGRGASGRSTSTCSATGPTGCTSERCSALGRVEGNARILQGWRNLESFA